MADILVWFVTVLLFAISVSQDAPEVALDEINCPVGPGVNRQTILIDTVATCRCVVTKQGTPPAQARWYTQDNQTVGEDGKDNSSVLTISYNSSDPNPTYQCRPFTTQNTSINEVTYIPQFRCSYNFVEVGSTFNFTRPVPSGVSSIMWQWMKDGLPKINISTCCLVDNNCTDTSPNFITADVNGTEHETSLHLYRVILITDKFSFLADTGERSCTSELEIYDWPSTVYCESTFTPLYVEITCETDKVWPSLVCKLSRAEKPLEDADFDPLYTQTGFRVREAGGLNPILPSCTWQLLMEKMLPNSQFIGELSALVSNYSKIHNTPTTGTTFINFTVPAVKLDENECPLGDTRVKTGTTAYCRCVLTEPLSSPAQARWYNKYDGTVGSENTTDKSSTLLLKYDPSDPNPKYYCKPFTKLPGNVIPIHYSPKLNNSPRQSTITGLVALIIIVGAVMS